MLDEVSSHAKERMEKSLVSLSEAFSTIRTGRANAGLLDRIRVDYYGTPTPINQMAAVKSPDAHMLVIEPWDKSSLNAINHAIVQSDLGVNPSNDGSVIRLPFPALTQERRIELVKQCKTYAEEARVSVRGARQEANKSIDKLKKDSEISEDDAVRKEAEIQKLTDSYIAKVDEAFKKKDAEVMEI